MRLPMTPNVSTKDGTSNKNARLTNCLKETTKRGDMAVIRPGLVLEAEGDGVGGGLVAFNNELVSVYGATLGLGYVAETPSIPPADDFATFDPYGSGLGLQGPTASDGTSVIVGVGFGPTEIYKSSNLIDFASSFSGFLGSGTNFPIVGYGLGYYWLFIYNGGSNDVKLYRSDTSASSFTLVHTFLNASLPANHGRPFFWFSGTDMYATFIGISPNTNYRFSSSDNGATWSGATVVADIYTSGYATGQWQMTGFGSSFYTVIFDGSGQPHIASTSDNFATVSFGSGFGDATYSCGYLAKVGTTLYRFYTDGSRLYVKYDSSPDGVTWTYVGIAFTHGAGKVCTLQSGALIGSVIVLYIIDALTVSPWTSTPYVVTLDPGSPGYYPPLGTIQTGLYDFAQSPL